MFFSTIQRLRCHTLSWILKKQVANWKVYSVDMFPVITKSNEILLCLVELDFQHSISNLSPPFTLLNCNFNYNGNAKFLFKYYFLLKMASCFENIISCNKMWPNYRVWITDISAQLMFRIKPYLRARVVPYYESQLYLYCCCDMQKKSSECLTEKHIYVKCYTYTSR